MRPGSESRNRHPRGDVREHHAPVGALRPNASPAIVSRKTGQGAPRTCRCIETVAPHHQIRRNERQGAPRTCRCIETPGHTGRCWCLRTVREHHAPVGALRRPAGGGAVDIYIVREHHAPVGALRQPSPLPLSPRVGRQGAPRTCRCIETFSSADMLLRASCQGAPRTCRCIETRT